MASRVSIGRLTRMHALAAALAALLCVSASMPANAQPAKRKVIIFVWDGLRPDSINASDTPNLFALREAGVDFTDNHSSYPTFTMINAASFATGGFAGTTGYYGNQLWQPGPEGPDAAGKPVDFQQPVFSEDYAILQDLTTFYRNELFLVETLFEAAQKAGLSTVAIGKTGAAFIQDYKRGGMMLDEKTVLPLDFAKELQAAGIPLPATTPNAYAKGEIVLTAENGDPTAFKQLKRLKDGKSADATDISGSPYKAALQYMFDVYVKYVLPKKNPDLSVVWIRDPDTSQHAFGVGSANARDALRSNDLMLGQLRGALKELGLETTTDIIVVSDHAHSNISGSTALFPLRAIQNGEVGPVDPAGYPVSGLVRIADLMGRAGFSVFDGMGCSYLPASMGIKADGTPVYDTFVDTDGTVCGKVGEKYNTGPRKLPAELPPKSVVVAVNGGSDYLYVPDHDAATVAQAVAFLQSLDIVGPIFVASRYGALPGTMPLDFVHIENAAGRSPDVVFSYDYDENALVNGVRGTEYSGSLLNSANRGMHGSFSPIDVHNTLIAHGPDFRENLKNPLPSGNVDVAPTVASILGLRLPKADGRPLLEALRNGPPVSAFAVTSRSFQPRQPALGLHVQLPTDPTGKDVDPSRTAYSFYIETKTLSYDDKSYMYFDKAKAVRQ